MSTTSSRRPSNAVLTPVDRDRAAWARLPTTIARDMRLDAAALVFIAHRATFVGDFAANIPALLRKPIVRTGLGRDVIKRTIRLCRAIGYLDRRQPRPRGRGSFGFAQERLVLPDCGASPQARCTWRAWFDGTLNVKELAAYIFMLAGTGSGPRVYAAELAERFGWSEPTVAKVINGLIAADLIVMFKMRTRNGQIRRIGYQPLPKNQPTKKRPKGKNQPTKNQSTHLLSSSKKDPSSHKGKAASLAAPALGAAPLAAAHEGKPTPTPATPSAAPFAPSANDRAVAIARVEDVAPKKMAAAVAKVVADTTSRVSAPMAPREPKTAPKEPAPPGTDPTAAAAALEAVLNTMRARIGRRMAIDADRGGEARP